MRTPTYSFRDFEKLLKKNKFSLIRKKGDHFIYTNEGGKTVSVPFRPNKMVLRRLIKENNLKH